jgi:hypothetical protein
MNNLRDYMMARRVSGEAICELPKGEPVVVFNKNLKNLVENTIWIKHHVYSAPFFRRLVQKSDAKASSKCPPHRLFAINLL